MDISFSKKLILVRPVDATQQKWRPAAFEQPHLVITRFHGLVDDSQGLQIVQIAEDPHVFDPAPLELAGDKDAFAKAEAELRGVGLGARLDHYPAQLSGGEQQRVALARAAAPQPSILLADEPTGNLDGATGEAIIDLIFGLAERRGTTVILVTHDPGLAARCARQVQVRDGRIAEDLGSGGVSGASALQTETA